MSKLIFFGLPAHGHINPTLPVVKELIERGEEVVYYANDSFSDRLRSVGAEYRPYRDEFLSTFANIPERLEQMPHLLMKATRDLLRDELERLHDDRPAYVIQDSLAPWGKSVAEILKVPVISSITTFAFNWRLVKLSFDAGAASEGSASLRSKLGYVVKALGVRKEIRRRHRIKGPQLVDLYMTSHSALNIVYTSKYFQPFANTFDRSYKFVGPAISCRSENADFPWDELQHEVIVYISMGTLYNNVREFYERCFKALGRMNCQVVLSLGDSLKKEDFDEVPPNFIIRNYMPQLQILERASVFITRGGMNSVSESLYHHVPVIVVPHLSEQSVIADRVVQLGAGICLRTEETTSDRIGEAVRNVLADDSFRQRSREIAESFEGAGGAKEAVAQILAFIKSEGKGS